MMKHVIILVILLVISLGLLNTEGRGNLSLTLTPEIMSLRP